MYSFLLLTVSVITLRGNVRRFVCLFVFRRAAPTPTVPLIGLKGEKPNTNQKKRPPFREERGTM